jgi:outer membrane protein TolC
LAVLCTIVAGPLLLGGCAAIAPKPISVREIQATGRSDRDAAQRGVVPLPGTLTLDEAIARAFKYNLDQRIRLREQEIALGLWQTGRFDLLPRALATAGYRTRDQDLITRSKDSVTGLPSLAHPYISSDRNYELYDLGLTWSMLDLSVGYFNAKQNASRALVAAEHRRKAMHALARDVTSAFWRFASAQKLIGDVRATIAQAEQALNDLTKANAEGLRSPVDNLRYQRQLLENIRLLVTIERDFTTAKTALCTLINAPLDAELTLAEPSLVPNIDILNTPVGEMEEIAIRQNADLREKAYDCRIAAEETRKTIAKLLPNISLSYDYRYNTDSYLINSQWNEAGLQISFNLLNVLSARSQMRLAKAGVELAAERRVAMQMALLAQVHVARIELASTYRQFQLADKIWQLDQGIKQYATNREDAQADSKLTKIASEATSIVSMLRRYQALVDFNVASSALQATLGWEPEIGSLQDLPLPDVTRTVASWQEGWQSGKLAGLAETSK